MPEGSALITNFLESEQYVYLTVQLIGEHPVKVYFVHYSKKTSKIRTKISSHDDPPLSPIDFQNVTPEELFVEIKDAIKLLQRTENWEEHLTDPEDRALLESMKAQMANVKPEDNPVICVYTLQDF